KLPGEEQLRIRPSCVVFGCASSPVSRELLLRQMHVRPGGVCESLISSQINTPGNENFFCDLIARHDGGPGGGDPAMKKLISGFSPARQIISAVLRSFFLSLVSISSSRAVTLSGCFCPYRRDALI